MILLLGKNEVVEQYAKDTLKIDMDYDIVYYPDNTDHYTELNKYIEIARQEEPPVITTQNIEMLDVLLTSDLELEVITVKENKRGIWAKNMSKEEAFYLRKEYNMELRS